MTLWRWRWLRTRRFWVVFGVLMVIGGVQNLVNPREVREAREEATRAARPPATPLPTSEPRPTAVPTTPPTSGPGWTTVRSADFGETWPLSVDGGVLRCDRQAVTFETGGSVYAVNGVARSRNNGREIEPIWLENPSIAGTRKNIGVLISRGLALCPGG